MSNDIFPLDQLPKDLLQSEIAQYLSTLEQYRISSLHNKHLFFSFLPGATTAIKELLLHVVRGKKTQAEKLLQQAPELLLEKRTIEDYSGRKIHGTALQIALGAKDVSINQQEEMAEMLERYLRKLPDGEKHIAKQLQEQFPLGWEEKENARKKQDSAELHKVITAIDKSSNDQDCELALIAFRNYLQPKELITSGNHFNSHLFTEACRLYDENYTRFGQWNSRKNNLMWIKVCGYIARFLPACDAQALCGGLFDYQHIKDPINRSLQYEIMSFFPLDKNSPLRLGYEVGMCSYINAWPYMTQGPNPWFGVKVMNKPYPKGGAGAAFFHEFQRQKNTAINQLRISSAQKADSEIGNPRP